MALEVAIKKYYPDFSLDVNFYTEKGILGVLGASGCGKSMTLKCIAGIETPDEGKIILNGRVLFDSEKKINLSPQKRNIGYLFQNYALFPHMNVEENTTVSRMNRPYGICITPENDIYVADAGNKVIMKLAFM